MSQAQLTKHDARTEGRKAVQDSVPKELWKANGKLVADLKQQIANHRISNHPLIGAMAEENFDIDSIRRFHLESNYAFVSTFTDCLLEGMVAADQLVDRFGIPGKMAARFLLQINILDELGYVGGGEDAESYAGAPYDAHLMKFQEVMGQLGIGNDDVREYRPSPEAVACRKTFSETYGDYISLTIVLALSENVFPGFATSWAKNTGASSDINVSEGYHAVHVDDGDGSIEDDHSEDSWYLVRQAVTPQHYDEIRCKVKRWLDVWADFADSLLQ